MTEQLHTTTDRADDELPAPEEASVPAEDAATAGTADDAPETPAAVSEAPGASERDPEPEAAGRIEQEIADERDERRRRGAEPDPD